MAMMSKRRQRPVGLLLWRLPVILCLLVATTVCLAQQDGDTDDEVLFDGCDPSEYYSVLTSSITPTRAELEKLLRDTHRRRLPYTDSDEGDDDVWKALADLDPGTEPGTVRLLYRQVDMAAAQLQGQTAGWNREHLWPKSRGVGISGADFTDIHHLRPADWNVNAARGNKYFGDCRVGGGTCQVPAHEQAANDTAASRTAFLPPAAVRGDIARALFYMDVRYSGVNGDLDLHLTDCPAHEFDDTGLAFLSQLLTWHAQDPVSPQEMARNNRACERWQGNRNPFVDNANLAQHLFGKPQPYPYDCDMDDIPTDVACAGPGAVMITGVNSDNPDSIAMVAMENLRPGMILYLTDNAWSATAGEFKSTEGIVSLRVPSTGIAKGTVFGIGPDEEFSAWNWQKLQGNFLLSASGDTLILYCRDATAELHLIAGLSYGGYWTDKGGDSTKSALPPALENVAVTLEHVDNYMYRGPTQGSVEEIRQAIQNSDNWESSENERFTDMASLQFELSSSKPSGAAPSPPTTTMAAASGGGTSSSRIPYCYFWACCITSCQVATLVVVAGLVILF